MNRIISEGDTVLCEGKEHQVALIAGITAKLTSLNFEPIYRRVSELTFVKICKLSPSEKLHAIVDNHLCSSNNQHIPEIGDYYTTKSHSFTDIYRLTGISESNVCTLENINSPQFILLRQRNSFNELKPHEFIFIDKGILFKGA